MNVQVEGCAYVSAFIHETLANPMVWPHASEPGSNLLGGECGYVLSTIQTRDCLSMTRTKQPTKNSLPSAHSNRNFIYLCWKVAYFSSKL
jgi:hypothetical protein